jgi:hypothetical protein
MGTVLIVDNEPNILYVLELLLGADEGGVLLFAFLRKGHRTRLRRDE